MKKLSQTDIVTVKTTSSLSSFGMSLYNEVNGFNIITLRNINNNSEWGIGIVK